MLSLLLAAIMLITAINISSYSKESVQAADLEMKVDSSGNITWTTTSKPSTAPLRFKTVAWNFSFYYKNSSGKWVQSPSSQIQVKLESGHLTYNGKNVGTYKSYSNAKMTYSITGLKDYYNGDDRAYKIIANAKVEFYRIYSNGKMEHISYASDKTSADSEASRLNFVNTGYFENYFNRNVEINNVNLKATCDSGLENPKINGTKGESTSNKKASVWVKKGSENKITVTAKEGYVCVSATKNGSTNQDIDTLSNGNGQIKDYKVTKNTTIKFTSEPYKIKVVYHVNDIKIGTQTFTYGSTDTLGNTDELKNFTDYSIKCWYTNEDLTGTKYKVNAKITSAKVVELYGTFSKKNDITSTNHLKTHTVNLYANSVDDRRDEKDDKTGSNPDLKIVYDGNGATSGTMSDQVAKYDTTIMLTHIKYKKTGYHTDSTKTWKTKKSGTYYNDAQSINTNKLDYDNTAKTKITLYAQWKPNTGTIVYDGNGSNGGSPVSNQKVTYDTWTTKISSNTYRKDGESPSVYWNTEPDGSGISIKAGTKIDEALWKKLFGSADSDGKTITLYAIWGDDTEKSTADPTVGQIGTGTLIYKAGEIGDDEQSDPQTYSIYSTLTLKECMFGEKYTLDTPKVRLISNRIWIDTDYMNDEVDYLIKNGTTVIEKDERYYKFMGWSVDADAIWSQSQAVISYPNSLISGKTLAFTYYGYLNPVKANSSWGTNPTADPISVTMPDNAAARASVINTSRDAWLQFESVLNTEITAQTNERDKQKALVAQYTAEIASLQAAKAAVPSPSYSLVPSGASKKEAKAIAASNAAAAAAYSATISRYNNLISQAQAKLDTAKTKQAEAQAKLNAAVKKLNALYKSITEAINDPNGTYLNAVWDMFPEFDEIDPIHIYMDDDYSYVTDEWLLNYIRVTDREDGVLNNGTDVVVENFDPVELSKLSHTGGVTVTFKATDSAGNVTRYTVTIIVEDRTPLEKTTSDDLTGKLYFENSYPRFFNRASFEIGDPESENYYGAGYDGTTINRKGQLVPVYLYVGGLHPESKWYMNAALKAEVYEALSNEENDTPEEVWEFTHEDILEIQEFIDTYGLGDSKAEGTLKKFGETFESRCKIQ